MIPKKNGRRPVLDMDAEKTGDHDNNDDHADDVEDVHCISPIEAAIGRPRRKLTVSTRATITAAIVSVPALQPVVRDHGR
jgi:hypothetical protein